MGKNVYRFSDDFKNNQTETFMLPFATHPTRLTFTWSVAFATFVELKD